MKKRNKHIYMIITFLSIMSCSVNLNPKESRILVIEEKRIDDSYTFFWFRGAGQITRGGLSYFQIAKDRCDLSFENANAYCSEAIQIYKVKGDSIFVLTQSEIKSIKINERFKIQAVAYSSELYEVSKRPSKENQYFLDSVCKMSLSQ